jgi:hypothetical protein
VGVAREVEAVGGADKRIGLGVSGFGFQVKQDRKVWNIGKMEPWNNGNTQYSSIPTFHIRDVTTGAR